MFEFWLNFFKFKNVFITTTLLGNMPKNLIIISIIIYNTISG